MDEKKERILKKTMKSKGLELYSYDHTFIYMYCHIHGFTGLYLKNYNDVSKFIGRTPDSVKMQISNVKYMLGDRLGGALSDFSEMHEIVYNDIKSMTRYSAFNKVKGLINQDEIERTRLLKEKGITNFRKA